jgi:FAD/FMN-containing dehydrogenase
VELSFDEEVRRSYARDASGLEMVADAIARPTTAGEVADVIRDAASTNRTVTAAGSQTSTTGASIADRGILMSMRAMSKVIDIDVEERTARVEPGVTIGALNAELAPLGLRFAPDPTSENDATIGGAIACNASGARSLRYGATRSHVAGVTLVDGNGRAIEMRRPCLEKNTVGFFAAQDPVDWIVGSEGTLGVVVRAELSLVRRPPIEVGLAIPFTSERDALEFVIAAREQSDRESGVRAECLEFFDGASLDIARGDVGMASWMRDASSLVYLEQALEEDGDVDAALAEWLTIAERHRAIADDIDVYTEASALRGARRFRHAVPAHMNEKGAARRTYGGRKVSTDWAVPFRRLPDALDFARKAADKHRITPAVTYGHAGNGHPHQNFVAQDADDLARITAAVDDTIRHVLALGGTVAAEHGLGKLKRKWLGVQLTPMQLDVMRALTGAIDPRGMFAPGNVFEVV